MKVLSQNCKIPNNRVSSDLIIRENRIRFHTLRNLLVSSDPVSPPYHAYLLSNSVTFTYHLPTPIVDS